MHPRVSNIIAEIIHIEAGFVDDPHDAGGATKYGVSLRYAKSKGLMWDLNGDGDVDVDDIRLVTQEDAFAAFLDDFYMEPRICDLPEDLQPQMTDFAVNSGAGRAVKSLQQVVTRLGHPTAVDGQIGPSTLRAVSNAAARFGLIRVNNDLVQKRLDFLNGIVVRKPSQRRFINGWTARARSYLL